MAAICYLAKSINKHMDVAISRRLSIIQCLLKWWKTSSHIVLVCKWLTTFSFNRVMLIPKWIHSNLSQWTSAVNSADCFISREPSRVPGGSGTRLTLYSRIVSAHCSVWQGRSSEKQKNATILTHLEGIGRLALSCLGDKMLKWPIV